MASGRAFYLMPGHRFSVRSAAMVFSPQLAMLFAHVVAQPSPIFRCQLAPGHGRAFTAPGAFLHPVIAHLLAHLPPFFRRQVTPWSLRPSQGGKQRQGEKQAAQARREALHRTFH